MGHTYDIFSVAFSPDGRYALLGSGDKIPKLWDIATGKELRTFRGHTSYSAFFEDKEVPTFVHSVAFSPDGRYGLSGGSNTLKLWDITTGKEIRTFKGHTAFVSSVAFSPDGKMSCQGSGDNSARVWDIATGKEIRTFKGHTGWLALLHFRLTGRYALSSGGKTLRLWDITTGSEIRTFASGSVSSVAFSPDKEDMPYQASSSGILPQAAR